MHSYILLFVFGFSYLIFYILYSNNIYLIGNCDEYYKGNSEQLNCSEVNSCPVSEQYPNHEPEKDPYEDKFIQESVNNKNLITIKHKHKFSQKILLNLSDLNYSTAPPVYDFLKNKYTLLKQHRNKSGIYLIHNNINGKKYIGSAVDLGKRLATYYFPSRLCDGRYISNSILKYGHGSFSVVILCILSNTSTSIKKDILNKEQEYINLYKPVYNLNTVAGSSMGFKHTEKSKQLISEFCKGKHLSDQTKQKLSALFSGELNPF
jgi:hypothetical protein